MPPNNDAPGLKARPRKDGSTAYYWIAAGVSREAARKLAELEQQGRPYAAKSVRLHHDTEDGRAAACRLYAAELMEWLANNGAAPALPFSGTIASLVENYQRDEDSPYWKLRENTRASYDHDLKILRNAVGTRRIDRLDGKDFTRWHENFVAPLTDVDGKPTGERRVRRAHGLMTMLRMLFGYGITRRFKGCAECSAILSEMRFETPAKRQKAITFAQAEAVVNEALKAGRVSIAMAQALQFEITVRQVDAIGYWVKAQPGENGIIANGKRWTGGLLWSDIDADLKVSKLTTKTASEGQWDLTLAPLVMKVLAYIPREQRIGPMIKDEETGLPYRQQWFSRLWRKIADKAEVPADVWNRDSRAGGLTEGDEAGADVRDLQRTATHSDAQTTERYMRRSLKASTRVAQLRVAARNKAAP